MLKYNRHFLGAFIGIFLFGVLNVTPVFGQDANIDALRLSGTNRYTTSAAISKEGWTQSSTVIIATGLGYADALAASSLAKSNDAPILLTQKDELNESIISELKRLKTTDAILVGGTGVIGAGVEDQLRSLEISIDRIGGSDRYDTSRKVAEKMGVTNGIIVATGTDFPDALSIAPIAGIKSLPILLSPRYSMNPNIREFVESINTPVSYIVGGTGAISISVSSSFPNSNRLGGSNRYETNLIINKNFEQDLNFDTVYLATGSNFPDALAGSSLAAKNNAPIFLIGKNSVSSEIIDFLKSKDVNHVVVLGGEGVVPEKTVTDTIESLTIHPSTITLNKASGSLNVGDTDTLTATLAPLNAKNKNINWTTTNASIASVDDTGEVTAVGPGSATITATTEDGNKAASCIITVSFDISQLLKLNIPYKAKDGLTVTVTDIKKVEEIGSTKYVVSYTLLNETIEKINEGTFKMYLIDGVNLPQYGRFVSLFPSESIERSYTFELLKTEKPTFLEYGSIFTATVPSLDTLKWKITN
jgi:putative cell wall-binding protein